MRDSHIIMPNGSFWTPNAYQRHHGYEGEKIANYFSISEITKEDYFVIADPLLKLLDEFRNRNKHPVIINSGFRSENYQKELRKRNSSAVKYSPHSKGMAADIETGSRFETIQQVQLLEQVAQDLKLNIRIGFASYLEKGMTFIHVDVCPEYYAKGKPWHVLSHPYQWELNARW